MIRRLLCSLLLLPLAAPGAGFSVSNVGLSGASLKNLCDKSEGECFSYVIGAISGFEVAYTVFLDAQRRNNVHIIVYPYCIPDGVTREKVYEAAKSYLYRHPERLQFDASSDIIAGLAEAYPCGKPR